MIRSARATAPVVAVALLTLIAVVTAGVVGTTVLETAPDERESPRHLVLSAHANATADRVALTHRGGDALDVADLRVVVSIDGQPLAHQPPVPFFAARGFEGGPTGPFNVATGGRWRTGQTAAVRLATTNSPQVTPGSDVHVEVYLGNQRIAQASTSAA